MGVAEVAMGVGFGLLIGLLFFMLDPRTGNRVDFASENQLRDVAGKAGIALELEPVFRIYNRYRYTWFDLVAALLLTVPPLAAVVWLLRAIVMQRAH